MFYDRVNYADSNKYYCWRCYFLYFRLVSHQEEENDALRAGVQALLRDRIIQAYNHYVCEKGWVPIYAKESIDACYKSYEALGDNGVIDNLMQQLNDLQNYPPKDKRMRGEDNA